MSLNTLFGLNGEASWAGSVFVVREISGGQNSFSKIRRFDCGVSVHVNFFSRTSAAVKKNPY